MKKIYSIFLIIALLVTVVASVSCSNGSEETVTGALPTLEIGDKWVSRLTSEGIEHTVTNEVTHEDVVNGIDCYVLEASIEPPLGGAIDSMTVNIEKATMDTISGQMSGEYMNQPYIMASSFSYKYSGDNSYPIEVGKEYKAMETIHSTVTMMGETQKETEENTYTNKCEKIEEITVQAGTFECFKIVKYDETGTNVIETSWLSDDVKQYEVKSIDYESGDTTELLSYSLN